MFSIRQEGQPFKSGFNFQFGNGKWPYVSAHYVHVDFTKDLVKRWSLRLRFKLWPPILCHKTEYNFVEERLKIHDAVIVSRVWYEDTVSILEDRKRQEENRLRKFREHWNLPHVNS